ncbi:MAG: hypothetical protein ACO4CI_08495, partial [Phycisphaerales bacterium]
MAPDLLHHDPRGLVERGESREVRPSRPANPTECRTWLRRRLGVAAIVRFATAGLLAVAASGFAAAQNAADVGPA